MSGTIQRDVLPAAQESLRSGVENATSSSLIFNPLVAGLDQIFDSVVITNILAASSISIPSSWIGEVWSYARSNLADGAVLGSALLRYSGFHRDGWILDLQPAAGAMTLDRHVFARGPLSLSRFVHELVHVTQYGLLGPVGFLVSYFGLSAAVIAWRFLNRQPLNHMRSSPHEDHAYETESRFDAWYASTHGGASAGSVTV